MRFKKISILFVDCTWCFVQTSTIPLTSHYVTSYISTSHLHDDRMSYVMCQMCKRVRKIVRHFESHKTKIQKNYHVPGTSQVSDFFFQKESWTISGSILTNIHYIWLQIVTAESKRVSLLARLLWTFYLIVRGRVRFQILMTLKKRKVDFYIISCSKWRSPISKFQLSQLRSLLHTWLLLMSLTALPQQLWLFAWFRFFSCLPQQC